MLHYYLPMYRAYDIKGSQFRRTLEELLQQAVAIV